LSYLQRLCVKNDTIGFFGPVGWAHFDREENDIVFFPGDSIIAAHEHFFESWALDAISKRLLESAKQWLPVRRLPSLAIVDTMLKLPLQPYLERGAAIAAALTLADGTKTSVQLAEAIENQGHASQTEALALIDSLENEGLVFRTGELPRRYGAERYLRAWLEAMPPEVSAPHRERLEKVCAARARLDQACGSAEETRDALGDMQRVFEEETQHVGRRGDGGFYEARTVVFQEAQRDSTMRLGRAVMDDIGPPLSVVLRAVRWYTQTLAERVTRASSEVFVATGQPRVEFFLLFSQVVGQLSEIAHDVARELQERWHAAISPLNVNAASRSRRRAKQSRRASPRLLYPGSSGAIPLRTSCSPRVAWMPFVAAIISSFSASFMLRCRRCCSRRCAVAERPSVTVLGRAVT
jgi:hypothetical protein